MSPFLKDPNQAYPISLVATALGRIGAFDDSITLANSIPDEQRKDEALVMIAVSLTSAKQAANASVLLASLPKVRAGDAELEANREMAFVRIAIAQANAGDGDRALKTLEAVRDPRLDDLSKDQRAYAQAVSGRFAEARALAGQVPQQTVRDATIRGQAFRLIAAVSAHQKGATETLSWVGQLTTPQDRTNALLGIADGLLGAPNQEIPPYFED